MSILEKTRASKGERKNGAVAAKKGTNALIVGGQPRVHLLPPEVTQRKNGRALRRRLGVGVIVAIIVMAVAIGLTTVAMLAAQASLASEQDRANDLVAQQAKYADVTRVQTDVTSIKNSQIIATSQEIAWQPYIKDLQDTLSSGMEITAFAASLDATSATGAVTSVPLQGPRIATLKVSVTSPQASISKWLDDLQGLTGFVDETPGSVALDGKTYKVDVVIHINSEALENRFVVKK